MSWPVFNFCQSVHMWTLYWRENGGCPGSERIPVKDSRKQSLLTDHHPVCWSVIDTRRRTGQRDGQVWVGRNNLGRVLVSLRSWKHKSRCASLHKKSGTLCLLKQACEHLPGTCPITRLTSQLWYLDYWPHPARTWRVQKPELLFKLFWDVCCSSESLFLLSYHLLNIFESSGKAFNQGINMVKQSGAILGFQIHN